MSSWPRATPAQLSGTGCARKITIPHCSTCNWIVHEAEAAQAGRFTPPGRAGRWRPRSRNSRRSAWPAPSPTTASTCTARRWRDHSTAAASRRRPMRRPRWSARTTRLSTSMILWAPTPSQRHEPGHQDRDAPARPSRSAPPAASCRASRARSAPARAHSRRSSRRSHSSSMSRGPASLTRMARGGSAVQFLLR